MLSREELIDIVLNGSLERDRVLNSSDQFNYISPEERKFSEGLPEIEYNLRLVILPGGRYEWRD